MIPLSVIVLTRNEEKNISECLNSIRSADDIIVVDAQSKDQTVKIAHKFTPSVFIKPWMGFAEAKTFATTQTKYDWVFWLDADERVTPELSQELERLLLEGPKYNGYTVARRAYFLGRWIRHSGWYPGRVPRLFNKKYARFNSAAVHEGLEIDGPVGTLKNDLLHYTDPNLYHYITKLNRYTSLAAEELVQKNKKFHLSDVVIHPPWMFFKMYVIKKGFMDGIQGLLLALLSSLYVFTKYAKLWDLSQNNHRRQVRN
jgi:glycosyltransferase involved in cell wall biosynthesis